MELYEITQQQIDEFTARHRRLLDKKRWTAKDAVRFVFSSIVADRICPEVFDEEHSNENLMIDKISPENRTGFLEQRIRQAVTVRDWIAYQDLVQHASLRVIEAALSIIDRALCLAAFGEIFSVSKLPPELQTILNEYTLNAFLDGVQGKELHHEQDSWCSGYIESLKQITAYNAVVKAVADSAQEPAFDTAFKINLEPNFHDAERVNAKSKAVFALLKKKEFDTKTEANIKMQAAQKYLCPVPGRGTDLNEQGQKILRSFIRNGMLNFDPTKAGALYEYVEVE